MAKKKKNLIGIPVRRIKEKNRIALRKFDLMMFFYVLTVVAAVLVGRSGEYDLRSANLHGFALTYLLVPAYLILELLSIVNCIGNFNWNFAGVEAELLGICDLLLGLTVWLWIRICGNSKGTAFINAAKTFVLIFVLWGSFQLGCCGALWLWKHGGFSSFNRHLLNKTPAVEPVHK